MPDFPFSIAFRRQRFPSLTYSLTQLSYLLLLLRYESSSFYDQATLPGNAAICGNQTASQVTAFQAAVEGLLADLEVATPRTDDFYVAYKKEVVGGGGATVYGMAQCAETVSPSACQECLKVANGNINSCLPSTYGRAVDAGCFLRYSNTPFFADNQTTNITPFLEKGEALYIFVLSNLSYC